MKSLLIIILVINLTVFVRCFVPAELLGSIVSILDHKTKLDFGEVSETLTHDIIFRRGLIHSIVKYFQSQPNGTSKINISRMSEYYDIKKLYFDYYGEVICNPPANLSISFMELDVSFVDLNPKTKDLPYAHFDAETFIESNNRVINYTSRIYDNIYKKNYEKAREYTGKILHTIHDFYSHSNWIEIGKTDINKLIGSSSFATENIVDKNDNLTCISNCTLIETKCNSVASLFKDIIKFLNMSGSPFECPLKFYRCSGNIITNKLVSGFYTGQKLDDGTQIKKPDYSMKCSHGGMLDKDSFKEAAGGINKDSGFYLFSPRADLHLKAANLAIKHTEYFFDNLRERVGDDEFANFLNLKINISDFDSKTLVTDISKCFAKLNKVSIPLIYLDILIFYLIFHFIV